MMPFGPVSVAVKTPAGNSPTGIRSTFAPSSKAQSCRISRRPAMS